MPGKSLNQKRDCNDLEKSENAAEKDGHSCNKELWPLKYKQRDRKQIKCLNSLNERMLKAEKINTRKLSLIVEGNKYLE